ncbi:Aspartyl/glutamyl-tRNA(Asn/Gln) amidotransferase subunit B [Candidatus Hodgkinia cicadicola]|nr:Aspartyl/glutamyl-tRNA(Asn/Gln) amidotransferase subunit B [Candidatus Hodgkinia cicadicola]
MPLISTFCPRNYLLIDNAPIEISIGLEVHTQLNLLYKLFSGSLDTLTTLDVGLPGSLPVVNFSSMFGLYALASLLHAKTSRWLSFTRKGYFCADLALGYQITQFHNPLLSCGFLEVWSVAVNGACCALIAHIQGVNLEHDAGSTTSLRGRQIVSFSRAGLGLLEFVSLPCFDSAFFVKLYLLKLKLILKCLRVSFCVMADAEMRYDFNISVSKPLCARSARIEIKNLNSLSGLDCITLSEAAAARGGSKSYTKAVELKTFVTSFLRRKETMREYKRLLEADIPFIPVLISKPTVQHRTVRLSERALWIVSCGLVSFLQTNDSELILTQALIFSCFGFKFLGLVLKEPLL